MKILIILLMFIMCINFVIIHSNCDNNDYNTNLLSPIEKIFNRKRRFIVFPNYSAIKLTVALSKSLIIKYPKGVGLTIEVSTYYPLQTMLEEWYPKQFRNPKPTVSTTSTTKQTSTIKSIPLYYSGNNFINSDSEVDDNWHLLYSNVSSIDSDENVIGESILDGYQIHRNDEQFPENTHHPPSPIPFNSFSKNQQHYKIPNSQNQLVNNKIHPYYYQKNAYYDNDFNSYKRWKISKSQRDRRHIYDHFEELGKKFRFDSKSCILRSICESKYYLLPPGYSLIQDLLRLLFSFPTIDGQIDEYSQAMTSKTGDCDKKYEKLCAISFLKLIL